MMAALTLWNSLKFLPNSQINALRTSPSPCPVILYSRSPNVQLAKLSKLKIKNWEKWALVKENHQRITLKNYKKTSLPVCHTSTIRSHFKMKSISAAGRHSKWTIKVIIYTRLRFFRTKTIRSLTCAIRHPSTQGLRFTILQTVATEVASYRTRVKNSKLKLEKYRILNAIKKNTVEMIFCELNSILNN